MGASQVLDTGSNPVGVTKLCVNTKWGRSLTVKIPGFQPRRFAGSNPVVPTTFWPVRLFGIEDSCFSGSGGEFESLTGHQIYKRYEPKQGTWFIIENHHVVIGRKLPACKRKMWYYLQMNGQRHKKAFDNLLRVPSALTLPGVF